MVTTAGAIGVTPSSTYEKIKQHSDHPLRELFPKLHAHYRFEDFFHLNRQSGTITDWNKSRNILVSEDFIIGLIHGLDEEVGSASSTVMYNIGKAWGERDSAVFKNWYEEEYETNMLTTNLALVLESWWWPFTAQGWGNWEVDLEDQKNGFIVLNIFDSAIARTLGNVGKPVCHVYAGLFAGFFSSFSKQDLGCVELQCYAMGSTFCKFLLGKQDRVDAASFWLEEGAGAKDIQKRLINGEYLG
ncbi:MAG: V4R domain-containing protein [Synechococcus sp.]